MKKVVVVFLLLCLSFTISAQRNHAGYIIAQFTQSNIPDIGARFDYKYLYISGTLGRYRLGENGYVGHQKLALGAMYFLPKQEGMDAIFFISWGISYHNYQKHLVVDFLPVSTYNPLSLEFGVGYKFFNGLSSCIAFDPIKNEGSMCLGYNF